MASVGVPKFAIAIAIKAFINFPGNPKRKSFKIPFGVLHQKYNVINSNIYRTIQHLHLPQQSPSKAVPSL
jgi:hypothetical protein